MIFQQYYSFFFLKQPQPFEWYSISLCARISRILDLKYPKLGKWLFYSTISHIESVFSGLDTFF